MPRDLVGWLRVQRRTGFLPLRFSKRIEANGGLTTLAGVALFPFEAVVLSSVTVELR